MYTRAMLSVATLVGLSVLSPRAMAFVYTVDCGSGGSLTSVQTAVTQAATGDSVAVTGSCAPGTLSISNKNVLTLSGLTIQGPAAVLLNASTHIYITGLTLNSGTGNIISVSDHSSLNATNTVLNGGVQSTGNSSITFNTLTVNAGNGGAILCLQGSDCHFTATTAIGLPSGDP